MNYFVPILAEADAGGVGSSMTEEARYRLFSVTVFAVVILAVFIWAAFIRKQKGKRRRIYKRHPHIWQQSEDGEKRRGRHRHHRKRAPDLPQNPSLADSGGLPPRRPDDVPPKGA
jgi:hypothetical protein